MKPLSEYTTEELLALPIFEMFSSETCVVDENLNITRKNGQVHPMTHMKRGDTVNIPVYQPLLCTPFGPNDPIFFWDADGEAWAPCMTENGWARSRFW